MPGACPQSWTWQGWGLPLGVRERQPCICGHELKAWVPILLLTLSSCVTLGGLLEPSVPPFPQPRNMVYWFPIAAITNGHTPRG